MFNVCGVVIYMHHLQQCPHYYWEKLKEYPFQDNSNLLRSRILVLRNIVCPTMHCIRVLHMSSHLPKIN